MKVARSLYQLSQAALPCLLAVIFLLVEVGCTSKIAPAPSGSGPSVTATTKSVDKAAETTASSEVATDASEAEAASTETAASEETAPTEAASSETAATESPAPEAPPVDAGPSIETALVVEQVAAGEPAKNDVLNMYYPDDPDKLNPVLASDDISSRLMGIVCESLGRRRFSDPEKWDPLLAESWTFDEENLEYTINLRKGVYWHPVTLPNGEVLDGVEFTSRDVKFTFDCILNEHTEAGSIRSYYVNPEEKDPVNIVVTPISKYVVKIKWKRPYFLMQDYTFLDPQQPLIPRHVYSVDAEGKLIDLDFSSQKFGKAFNDHWANDKLIGTGPYRLVEWKRGDRLLMERNEKYWGKKPHFSEIYYRMIANPETAVQSALAGTLDLAGVSEFDRYVKIRDQKEYDPAICRPLDYDRTAYRYLGYNMTRPLFQDRRVRVALSHAVPVDQIIESVYAGLAVRQNGPFLPGTPYAADVTPIPYDLEKAKALLKEAGWEDTNGDGIVDKELNGTRVPFAFEVMIFADSPQYEKLALLIQENFRRIGVKMDPIKTKWQIMLENLNKKNFDATILGWAMDYKSDPFQIFHGSQANIPDTSNYGYVNPEVDALIDKLRATPKEEDQIPIYQEIHRLVYEDQPYTFLVKEKSPGLINSRIENFVPYPELRPHYDRLEWTSTKARVKR